MRDIPLTDAQRKKYLETDKAKRKLRSTQRKEETEEERMLKDIRDTDDVETKRNIVSKFNPNHYVFGTSLNPNEEGKPYAYAV